MQKEFFLQYEQWHLTHIAPLKLVDFGLHHDGVVVDRCEGDLVWVCSVFFLKERSK